MNRIIEQAKEFRDDCAAVPDYGTISADIEHLICYFFHLEIIPFEWDQMEKAGEVVHL